MEIVSGVVGKLLEYAVAPIGRQFGYLIFYQRNVNELKEQLHKLRAERESLQHVVNGARRNGEEIERNVEEWFHRVDELIALADNFSQEESQANSGCSYKSCPNLWLRHQLSRKAMKTAKEVVKVNGEGKFERVSYIQPPQWAATSSTSFYIRGEAFASRVSTLNSIVEALADSTMNMVGVYGLPGVGKSTLAKEVAKKAQGENLYDTVVMVEVKQNPDNKTIQREIADMVGLKFDEESEVVRASRLRERLKQEKKLLVILDDIWGRVDLHKIGIPPTDEQKESKIPSIDEYRGCKILLTSRSEEVLSSQMNCKRNIKVEELFEVEAWELFKEKAELHDDSDPDLLTIATQVIDKCAGLPIAIVTVARALRNKGLFEWRDALWQLQQPTLRNVSGVKEIVDSSIKLSYEHLESKELKLVFLLCAMLAEDANTIELLNYCVGLGLFQGIYTMEAARNRLQTLIQKLKSSCLLLEDSTYTGPFRMHDVIRAVALSIASDEQDAFVLSSDKIDEWPNLENYKFMCLRGCDIKELREKLPGPRLEVLLISCNDTSVRIPENFFGENPLIRVIDLTSFHLSSLPKSMVLLTNLTTLLLDLCVLADIAIIGELKNLKVLSFFKSIIQQLPQELGQLSQLRLLDLDGCTTVIPENLLSGLKKLETLYLDDSFNRWQDERSNGKTGNARIAELKDLANLSTLHVHIPDASILPKDFFMDKLKRYKLLVGDVWEWSCAYKTSKILKLKLETNIHLKYELKSLFESVESLYLDELIGIKDVVYELNNRGFPHLRHLWIQNNSHIECIINSSAKVDVQEVFPKLETLVLANMSHLQKLCQGQHTMKSWRNLRVIDVESCNQMKSVFSISLVRSFSQLVELKISTCKLMNQIVDFSNKDKMDNTTIDTVRFLKLRSLKINNLPALVSFCIDDTRCFDSHDKMDTFEPLFNDKVIFPDLVSLRLSSINFQKIWHDSLSSCSWVKSMTNLTIEGCGRLRNIISTVQAMCLVNLKHLEISRCEKVEEIFSRTEDAKGKEAPSASDAFFSEEVIFPNLETMILSHMDNLQKIWPDQCAPNCFNKLKNVEIDNCEKLVIVFPSYMLESLSHVEMVEVTNCISVETLYDLRGDCNRGGLGELKTNLRNLKLLDLPNLIDIWSNDPGSHISFSNLRTVNVNSCERLKSIFPTYVALNLDLLEVLDIRNCEIEEVVEKEEIASGITTFNLPCLTVLWLVNLFKLKSFYPRTHILACIKLKKLHVVCPKLELFGLETKNFPATRDDQPLFSVDKVVPHLELLSLSGKEARKIWRGQFREDLYHNITSLYLHLFENKVERFPYWFLHKVPNLKDLYLDDCYFREVFHVRQLVAEEKQTADTVRLEFLLLVNLPRLESICSEGVELDPVLEKLEELHVLNCSGLSNLISASASFNCLTLLEITNCDGLKSLVSPSTAKGLVHLKKIRIEECKMLQEIVAKVEDDNEDEISFSQLESLELTCLPNLSSFCLGNNNFDFPYLEEVIIKQCPKMKIFSQGELRSAKLHSVCLGNKNQSSWKGDLNSTITNLYDEKVGLCGIEKMNFVEYPELIETWNGKLPDWSFSNLEILTIDKCDVLSCAIPSHLFSSLINLEELQVSNCNSIQVVFDLQEINQTDALVPLRLKKMTLENLPKLMYMWNKDPQQIDMCQHLQELYAKECQSLRSIFPPSIAKSLKQLQKLVLFDCGVEEIILKEKNTWAESIFVFPQLFNLTLLRLSKLRNFYPQRHKLECPKLKTLVVGQCDILTQHPLFLLDTVNLNLEDLTLNQKAFMNIRDGHFQVDLFHKVNFLCLESFLDKPLTFPYSFLEGFPNLNKLYVQNSSFEEIFQSEEPLFDHLGNFPPVKKLVLIELDQLKSLMNEDSQLGPFLQNLEILAVHFCPMLKNLAPSSALFDNLQSLEVSNCHGLIYLVTSSTARSFVQLTRLKIANCVAMEEVVTVEVEAIQNEIAFQKLECLELSGLSNLKSFCTQNCTFEFPSLVEIIVEECFNMKMFCPGILSTPVLVGVVSADDLVCWEDNLNKTIQLLHMVGHDEKMKFDEYPELIDVWNGKLQLPDWFFSNLKFLTIDKCDFLSCAMPSHLFSSLINLEELRVNNCNSIQEVFDVQEIYQLDALVPLRLKRMKLEHLNQLKNLIHTDSQSCPVLQYLENLEVQFCPRLTNLAPSSVLFDNLKSMDVSGCHGLIYLVTSSAARSFARLKWLKIADCTMLEEIVRSDTEDTQNKVVFQKLEYVVLIDLSNLKSFSSQNCTFEFPSLVKITVKRCFKMEMFCPGILSRHYIT